MTRDLSKEPSVAALPGRNTDEESDLGEEVPALRDVEANMSLILALRNLNKSESEIRQMLFGDKVSEEEFVAGLKASAERDFDAFYEALFDDPRRVIEEKIGDLQQLVTELHVALKQSGRARAAASSYDTPGVAGGAAGASNAYDTPASGRDGAEVANTDTPITASGEEQGRGRTAGSVSADAIAGVSSTAGEARDLSYVSLLSSDKATEKLIKER